MRRIATFALLVGLGTLVGTAGALRADQTDPRLESLFVELEDAAGPEAAHRIETRIWQLWTESEDRAVELLMADGMRAMAERNYPRALGKFDQVVAIAPDFAEGWNKRATVHYVVGQYERSLADIEKTLALEPRHFGALSGRGLVYMELGEPEKALESFEAALKVYPQMQGARHNAEALRRRLGDQAI